MRYAAIYLVVKDFDKSVSFYEKLLDKKVSARNGSRFAMFDGDGIHISLMNGLCDSVQQDEIKTVGGYYPAFDDFEKIIESENSRKIFINIFVDDLKKEYGRIISLGIAEEITPIRFVEYSAPYWYFTLADPDGNPIEITGGYDG